MMRQYIEQALERDGVSIDHPMVDEFVTFYALEYLDSFLTVEDLEILKNLEIDLEEVLENKKGE